MQESELRGKALFGSNVRALRVAQGLSQEAFANTCGLHRTYIGQVERGERNLSLDTMERIAAALQLDVSDMLRGPVRHAQPSAAVLPLTERLDLEVGGPRG